MDAIDLYNLLEDSPHFGVWFSIDPDETYFAGVRIGLMEIQQELYPYSKLELNVLLPTPLDIGHA